MTTTTPYLDASDPDFYDGKNLDTFTWIHENSPIYRCEATNTESFWNICRHDEIYEVGRDQARFGFGITLSSGAIGMQEILQNMPQDPRLGTVLRTVNIMDGAEHERFLAPLKKPFGGTAVRAMEPEMRAMVRGLLDDIPVGEEVSRPSCTGSSAGLASTRSVACGRPPASRAVFTTRSPTTSSRARSGLCRSPRSDAAGWPPDGARGLRRADPSARSQRPAAHRQDHP